MSADLIVAITGHRPNKIGGYDVGAPLRVAIREKLRHWLHVLEPLRAITGMALGVDQDFALVCHELGVPFTAAVPFDGQEDNWPAPARDEYRRLIGYADTRVVVSHGGYAAWKMQKRNIWMVESCNVLLAVWDGSKGGTANCAAYAQEVGRRIERIDPRELQHG